MLYNVSDPYPFVRIRIGNFFLSSEQKQIIGMDPETGSAKKSGFIRIRNTAAIIGRILTPPPPLLICPEESNICKQDWNYCDAGVMAV